jgi:hypothetical protein
MKQEDCTVGMPKSGMPWRKGSKKSIYLIKRSSNLYKLNKGL